MSEPLEHPLEPGQGVLHRRRANQLESVSRGVSGPGPSLQSMKLAGVIDPGRGHRAVAAHAAQTFLEERADDLVAAIEARGFTENRTDPELVSHPLDWIALLIIIGVCMAVILLQYFPVQ